MQVLAPRRERALPGHIPPHPPESLRNAGATGVVHELSGWHHLGQPGSPITPGDRSAWTSQRNLSPKCRHPSLAAKWSRKMNDTKTPFLTDVKTLRERARQHLDRGGVTQTYKGDAKKTVEILQNVLATEIVCVLRYTMHAVTATGISSEGVKAEFAQHAKEEKEHMMSVAERINQLGGKPTFNPEGLLGRSASQYVEGENLVDMIKENLIAERIAVDHYRELIRYFGDNDPGTRALLEGILMVEEEHANDMHDLLVAHEGRPML
jgi:bacterioferritin